MARKRHEYRYETGHGQIQTTTVVETIKGWVITHSIWDKSYQSQYAINTYQIEDLGHHLDPANFRLYSNMEENIGIDD